MVKMHPKFRVGDLTHLGVHIPCLNFTLCLTGHLFAFLFTFFMARNPSHSSVGTLEKLESLAYYSIRMLEQLIVQVAT